MKTHIALSEDMLTNVAVILHPPTPAPNNEPKQRTFRLTAKGWVESDSENIQKQFQLTNRISELMLPVPRGLLASRELICQINGVDPSKITTVGPKPVEMSRRNDEAVKRDAIERSSITKSPYYKVFREILTRAVEFESADIHIEVRYGLDPSTQRNGSRIRFRIDGDMHEITDLAPESRDPAFLRAMVGFVFNDMSEGKTDSSFNPSLNQSAQVSDLTINGRLIRGRYQTFGESGNLAANQDKPFKMVMRVLYADRVDIPTLNDLGFLPWQIDTLERLINGQSRMACVSGKVGSGKSTTLRTLFAMLPLHWCKYAAEDPVEYYHPNTTQLEISDAKSIDRILKSLKRGDLNSLLMGEVRGAETMSLIRNVAFSGHSVFTTTHSESALGQLPYFLTPEMGMNNYELSNPAFIGVLFHQALCKVLCPHCAIGGPQALQVLGTARLHKLTNEYQVPVDNLKIRNEEGCEHCASNLPTRRGFMPKKMDVLAEFFEPDLDDLVLIEQNKLIDLTIKWRSSHAPFSSENCHGKNIQEIGLYKALDGRIDLRSVESKTRPFLDAKVYNKPREI